MQLTKVIVKGKARSRIALGIATAYLRLHPNTTFKALKDVFPDSICPKAPVQFRSITPLGVFQPLEVVQSLPEQGLNIAHYTAKDELLHTSDGVAIAVTKSWTRESFDALTIAAAMHGIATEVVDAETKWPTGVYELEFVEVHHQPTAQPIQEPQPKATKEPEQNQAPPKKRRLRHHFWLNLMLLLLILTVGALLLMRHGGSSEKSKQKSKVDTITVLHPNDYKPVVVQQNTEEAASGVTN